MSLILEALRKSEAQRRRGRAPDLHAELPPAHARVRRTLSPWLWIACASALVLAAAILWPRGDIAPEPDAPAGRPAGAMPGTRANVASHADETPAPPPFPHVDRITAPPVPTAGRASTPASDTAASATAGVGDVATAEQVRDAAATPATGAPDVATADPPAMPDTPAPAPAPATAPTKPTAPAGATIKLSELSPEVRRQLPSMKLSMHMWNESPARRFVIIDGQRYVEGDRIGGAIVTAIDTDGVILDLDGRMVRVPIR